MPDVRPPTTDPVITRFPTTAGGDVTFALPTGEVTAEQWIRGTADGLRSLAQQHPRRVRTALLRHSGARVIDQPANDAEVWLVETVRKLASRAGRCRRTRSTAPQRWRSPGAGSPGR